MLMRRARPNLGHSSNPLRVRFMRMAICQQPALYGATHVTCPTCLRRRPQQRSPRASMPYRPTRSNHAVGLDLTIVRYTQGVNYTIRHTLDLATMHILILPCDPTKPSDVFNVFKETWMIWTGLPDNMVVDKGSELGA